MRGQRLLMSSACVAMTRSKSKSGLRGPVASRWRPTAAVISGMRSKSPIATTYRRNMERPPCLRRASPAGGRLHLVGCRRARILTRRLEIVTEAVRWRGSERAAKVVDRRRADFGLEPRELAHRLVLFPADSALLEM